MKRTNKILYAVSEQSWSKFVKQAELRGKKLGFYFDDLINHKCNA